MNSPSDYSLRDRTNSRCEQLIVSLVGDGYRRIAYHEETDMISYSLRNVRSRRTLKVCSFPQVGLIQLIEKRKVLKTIQL